MSLSSRHVARDSTVEEAETKEEAHDMSNNGFLLTLSEYKSLAREYINDNFAPPERMQEQLKLSEFIIWLRQREERKVESTKRTTSLRSITPIQR